MAEVEGYHDCGPYLPVEHAKVCAGDIAERELDEGEGTVHGSGFTVNVFSILMLALA